MSISHCLTGAEFSPQALKQLLSLAITLKYNPSHYLNSLQQKQIGLIFEKPSLRTRFSFSAGVNKLGGQVIESVLSHRKHEAPKDLIRVLQGYCDAVMVRTHEHAILQEMQAHARIPVINGLCDSYHPCQIFADLLSLKIHFQQVQGLKLAYIGDGNNILHSLLMLAPKLGVQVHYACPPGHAPDAQVLGQLSHPELTQAFDSPEAAVQGCHAVYTDVWTSMGFESQDESVFVGFQVNEALMEQALPEAVFMHCMPMERGKEVSATLPDAPCSIIFEQSANRLYAQQALLLMLLKPKHFFQTGQAVTLAQA